MSDSTSTAQKIILQTKEHWRKICSMAFCSALIIYLLILPVPRYYSCTITLAPELGSNAKGGSLSSIASSFGVKLDNSAFNDAISPMLYPELIKSNDFTKSLLLSNISTKDGKIKALYYDYLANNQKKAFYLAPISWISDIFSPKDENSVKSKEINTFKLTKKQTRVFSKVKGNIGCSVDIKTDLITISVEDQDPLVAATMANVVSKNLQQFIIKYRTNKSRIDMNYFKKLTIQAKQEYERARQRYSSFSDANMEVMLESYKSKINDLENDMQLKFNTYTSLNNQLQSAQAKVQESTPAFTVIQSASVPVKPAGPKRMAISITLTLLVVIVYIFTINRNILFPKQ